MTLDELCYRVKCRPVDLERWAELGAFGPRWKEPRDRGKWRHITRDTAQRAVVMAHLVKIGLQEPDAARFASLHEKRDATKPLVISMDGVEIIVRREELNLP